MAAMFGREVQQILMSPNPPNKIPVEDFQYSVNSGRASLSQQRIANARIEPADDQRDDDQGSQTSKRTRSPRKMLYTDIRNRYSERRPTDVRAHSGYPREGELRDSERERDALTPSLNHVDAES